MPFMRLGEFVIRAPKLDAAPLAIKDLVFSNPGAALKGIGHALVGWLLAAPIIVVVLAQLLRPVFAWAAQRCATHLTLKCSMCLTCKHIHVCRHVHVHLAYPAEA